ncbi:MAG: gamma-glutamyltransferase [Candidatus Eremiobacteraeota bacterium]|nr:gamma-glutamyltransferase [Candidatus Eremiobacteraeota bacterium]
MRTLVALALVALAGLGPVMNPGVSRTVPVAGQRAMVVTEQHYASRVGVDVLRRGGNAVDAAVAVAYALAVVHPCCGNLGGGGFMLVRLHDGRERFIDFREKAPLRATRDMYLDKRGDLIKGASTKGYLAVAIPGTVMGMERARAEFGTWPRERLMAPAIALAETGYRISTGDAAFFAGASRDVRGRNIFTSQANVRAVFAPHDRLPRFGDVVRQPQLARTLHLIARGGAKAFYEGPIATSMVAASRAGGGILSMRDFATYTVGESAPLHCTYRGYDVSAAPPPSSGGTTLCEILGITRTFPFESWGWNSTRSVHYTVEAERRAYADRNTYLGDPAFVRNPVAALLDPRYTAKLRDNIGKDSATPSSAIAPGLGPLHEGENTAHYSIVDRWGNAVAVTYTINDWFGAGVMAGNTGFFLNDEMDDFTSKIGEPNLYGLVQGARNGIASGKRPLSSMAPTIVTRGGNLVLVTGSPGGSRIITIVLSTIQNVIDYGMNVQDAVNAPRIHMQWLPDEVQYEPGALSPETMSKLSAMGYVFRRFTSWGSAQAIYVDPRTGTRYGGSDRRHPAGAAMGY